MTWWQWTLIGIGSLITVVVVGIGVMIVSLINTNPDSEDGEW